MIVGFRLLIMFLTTAALAQGSTSVLKGKVNAGGFNVNGIYVINLSPKSGDN
jgi:hypothetical protein